jgi:hypothetical protein
LSEQAVQQQHAAAGQQTTAEEQLDLTEYRSAAEGGHKFECACCLAALLQHNAGHGIQSCCNAMPATHSETGLPLPDAPLPADLDHTADVQLHACKHMPWQHGNPCLFVSRAGSNYCCMPSLSSLFSCLPPQGAPHWQKR